MGKLFDGKVILVTGAGTGVGQAAAVAYATNGATVIVSDVEITDTISMIKSAKSEAFFIQADVSNLRDCSRLLKKTTEKYGRLDIAFNSAGISGKRDVPDDMSADSFNRVISANLCGIFYCMKYEIQAMLNQGGGVIINSPSVLSWQGVDAFPGDIAAKHGLIGLTENAALKYTGMNIRIHCVAPQFLNAPLLETIDVKSKTATSLQHVKGQQGRIEDIAAMVLWLSSERGSSVTAGYYPAEDSCSYN